MSTELPYSTGPRMFARPMLTHVSLGKPLRVILFLMPVIILGLVLLPILGKNRMNTIIGIEIIWGIIVGTIISGVRVAAQWERCIVLRMGKYHSLKGPGVMYIVPFIDHVRFVDTRTLVLNIPSQKVITRDNVPAQIDGALFFLVSDPKGAVLSIQDFRFAIAQYAQAALRDVVGGLTLDELLSEREQVQERIGSIVEERIKDWGLHVDSIRLLDIDLPEELKKMMSRQASAEREKRATITKAEGDKMAATNLAEAAAIMHKSPGAMQLRSLQTIDGLGPSPSNTVVIFPAELSESVKALSRILLQKLESGNETGEGYKPPEKTA
jgi:regulator of protease activity HflC (stomatin/prohibitin superfamily)